MAYMRGTWYIFKDWSEIFHIHGQDGEFYLPKEILDQLVVMRFAQLSPEEVEKAEKKAVTNHAGNIGCDALCKKHGLPTATEIIDRRTEEALKKKKKGK